MIGFVCIGHKKLQNVLGITGDLVVKYDKFEDWFNEIENYSTRGDRFHDEFGALDHIKRDRMIEWLKAAWQCAKDGEKNDGRNKRIPRIFQP
jgi:hypothetical protein